MTAPFSTMDAGAIETRLQEIAGLESKHAARDMDGELQAAMRGGGDIDAVEDLHLQAQRTARRLRVERQALEAELPEARRRDARKEIAGLLDEHGALVAAAPEKIDAIVSAWAALKTATVAWGEHQKAAEVIASRIANLAQANGMETPADIGFLLSHRVIEVRDDWHTDGTNMLVAMTSSERGVHTVAGVRCHRVD